MFRQRRPRSRQYFIFFGISRSPLVPHLPYCFHRVGSIESANNLLRLHLGRIYTLINDRSLLLANDCSFKLSLRRANSRRWLRATTDLPLSPEFPDECFVVECVSKTCRSPSWICPLCDRHECNIKKRRRKKILYKACYNSSKQLITNASAIIKCKQERYIKKKGKNIQSTHKIRSSIKSFFRIIFIVAFAFKSLDPSEIIFQHEKKEKQKYNRRIILWNAFFCRLYH